MTEITLPIEALVSGIAALLVFAVGGTWKVVNAIAAGRQALKSELKATINEQQAAFKAASRAFNQDGAAFRGVGVHRQLLPDA